MRKFVLFIVLMAAITGCSYLKPTTHLDFKPFAEYTITLAADIEYGLSRNKIHYLRELMNDPVVRQHGQMWEGVRTILKGVVAYSVEVTTLGSSTLSGPERCDKFAEFVDNLVRPVLQTYPGVLHATEADLDTLCANIREQEDLLGALGEAQPLIDELARVSDVVFDRVADDLDIIADHLVTKIDSMNAETISYYNLIRAWQSQVFASLVLLGEYRVGDETAMQKLLELDPQLGELIDKDNKLSINELQAIEDRLLVKAQKAREFKEQLQPDLELYRLQQGELADIYNNARRQLTKARITLVVWSRSHRNLAQGIVDPAKVNIFDLTKKAIDTAL
jgi:hypothetical protein